MSAVRAAPVPFLDLGAVNGDGAGDWDGVWRRLRSHGRFVGGPEIERFEADFAAFCEADHCVGVACGTDALELILAGLGIGPGDEVIVPANTFVATAEAVCAVGALPRFVDVLPDTLNIDPDAVAAAVRSGTAAVMAVHLYGQPADVNRLAAVAERHGLAVVEDAAQAHGARFGGRRAGSLGTAAGFSFYPGKNLGAFGDAGAVVTDDAALARRVRMLGNHGRPPEDRHRHDLRGRNSRLDSLQAAVLAEKLPSLDAANAARARAMKAYRAALPPGSRPVAVHPSAEPVYHLAVVQVEDRSRVTAALSAASIGWGIHYPVPCHRQPAFTAYADGPLPVADEAAARIVSLPMHPAISEDEVWRVCEAIGAAS